MNKLTISRELGRNKGLRGWRPKRTQSMRDESKQMNTDALKGMPYAIIGALSKIHAIELRKPIRSFTVQGNQSAQYALGKITAAPIRQFAKSPAVSMNMHGTSLAEFT